MVGVVEEDVFFADTIRDEAKSTLCGFRFYRFAELYRRSRYISRRVEFRRSWPSFWWFLVLGDIFPIDGRVGLPSIFGGGIDPVLCRRTRGYAKALDVFIACLLHKGGLANEVDTPSIDLCRLGKGTLAEF